MPKTIEGVLTAIVTPFTATDRGRNIDSPPTMHSIAFSHEKRNRHLR